MPGPTFPRLVCVAMLACATLHAQRSPVLEGYVTRTGTPQDFDVNGRHVVCIATTAAALKKFGVTTITNFGCQPRIYGEFLIIYGKRDKKIGTIAATEIDATDTNTDQVVRGVAVIDKVLSPQLLRADGFALQISPATELHWDAPLTPSSKPAVNQWVEYTGKRDSSGVIVASHPRFLHLVRHTRGAKTFATKTSSIPRRFRMATSRTAPANSSGASTTNAFPLSTIPRSRNASNASASV